MVVALSSKFKLQRTHDIKLTTNKTYSLPPENNSNREHEYVTQKVKKFHFI